MPQPETQQTPAGVASPLVKPKRGPLEVLVFAFGSVILGAVVPFYVMGLFTVLLKFGSAQIKDFPLLLIIAFGGLLFLLHEGSVWGIVGLIVWLLVALGSVIYFNCYFPQQGQQPWQKCLASIVRACGGGALAFGLTLHLWSLWTLLRMPDDGEQPVYGLGVISAACVIGLFGALLAACWPLFAKTRA